MKTETVFDIIEIQKILKHRYPFLLIDKVIEFVDNKRITGVKNVSINEPFFQGHFPGNPVMPGALIMEALAQNSAFLAIKSTEGVGADGNMFLVGATDFKWKKMVRPGDTLILESIFLNKKQGLWIIDCKASVDNQMVAQGRLSAMGLK